MAHLKIVASLNAANKLGEAAVEIVAGNVQVTAGPRGADIRAHVKSRPVVRRSGNGRGRRFSRDVGSMSHDGHAYSSKRGDPHKRTSHGAPPQAAGRFPTAFKYKRSSLAVT